MRKKILLAIVAILSAFCIFSVTGCNLGKSPDDEEVVNTEAPTLDTSTVQGMIEASVLQYPATNEYFRYNVYTYYVTISECLTFDSNVTIPDEIEGLPVIGIEEYAFYGNLNLVSLNMNNNIDFIEQGAFQECTNLETVKTSPALTYIGADVFYECTNLTDIVIPGGVAEINQNTFFKCQNLKTVTIEPGSGTERTIYKNAFFSCPNLAHVWIPDDITIIENNAFNNSTENLTVYGCATSAAAVFSADYLVDFVVLDKDDFSNVVSDAQNDAPTIGEHIAGNTWDITLTGIEMMNSIDEYEADTGKAYMVLFFYVTNTSRTEQFFNHLYINTQVSGFDKEMKYLVSSIDGQNILSGSIAPGETKSGFILYEVNENWRDVKINFCNLDEFNYSESYFRVLSADI